MHTPDKPSRANPLPTLFRGLASDLKARLHRHGVARKVGKGAWAVADQGLYGAAHFILNIVLARWLSAAEYGAFAIAMSSFFIIFPFFSALIVEPMLVFGAGRYANRFDDYLHVLAVGLAGFSVLTSLILLGISGGFFASGSTHIAPAFFSLAIACPFMLLVWLLRRACYVRNEPRLAATGGGLYSLVVLLGTYLIYTRSLLTVPLALCLMGAASLLASLWLARQLGFRGWRLSDWELNRDVVRQHWIYGRWAAAARVPMRLPESIILFALPAWGGLAASGTIQALSNLVKPVIQVNGALGVLLIPTLSRSKSKAEFFGITRVMLVIFFVTAAAYWLLIGLFDATVVNWIYGTHYVGQANLLWILALMPLFNGGAAVLGAALRAREQPDRIFWSYTVSTALGLPSALGLLALFGLSGAAAGFVLLNLTTFAAMWYFYDKMKRRAAALSTAWDFSSSS